MSVRGGVRSAQPVLLAVRAGIVRVRHDADAATPVTATPVTSAPVTLTSSVSTDPGPDPEP